MMWNFTKWGKVNKAFRMENLKIESLLKMLQISLIFHCLKTTAHWSGMRGLNHSYSFHLQLVSCTLSLSATRRYFGWLLSYINYTFTVLKVLYFNVPHRMFCIFRHLPILLMQCGVLMSNLSPVLFPQKWIISILYATKIVPSVFIFND